MDCPSCYELYNSNMNCPLNFPCGHTFCRKCIHHLVQLNEQQIVKCPLCNFQFQIQCVNMLSKNFIALNLADDHKQQIKKKNSEQVEECEQHNEVIRYFCKNDKQKLCASCIIDHSGHQFVKIEDSQYRMQKLYDAINVKQQKIRENQNIMQDFLNQNINNINTNEKKQIENMESQFKLIIEFIKSRKETVLNQFEQSVNQQKTKNAISESQILAYNKEIVKNDQVLQKLQSEIKKDAVDSQSVKEQLETVDKEITKFDDKIFDLYIEIDQEKKQNHNKLVVDYDVFNQMEQLIYMNTQSNKKYCLFGYKDKILELNLETLDWKLNTLKMLKNSSIEFQYYSAAVTLETGDILLTGGSATKQTLLVSMRYKKIKRMANMLINRKEHCAVVHNRYVYVMGGYNAQNNSFLKECEKYDIAKNKWTSITSMNLKKCAFSSCLIEKQNSIYTFGGYTGNQRINEIELYNILLDQWKVLEIKLEIPLSNSASIYSQQENKIFILGGGHSQGFLHNIYIFDLEEYEIKSIQNINEGSDLRNKLILYDNYIYMVVGNRQQLERINVQTYKQEKMKKGYGHLVIDNLDSWSGALSSYSSLERNDNMQKIIDSQLEDHFILFESEVFIQNSHSQT